MGAYGSISIETLTKEECIELFKEVTKTRRRSRIDQGMHIKKKSRSSISVLCSFGRFAF